MQEVWKDVPNFEGFYQISTLGRVKSVARIVQRSTNSLPIAERILKPTKHKGYFTVILSKNGIPTTITIHRVVAQVFIPNPNNFPCINHIDENKENNTVSNLEWCTYSYNNSFNHVRERAAESKRLPILQYSLSGDFIREWAHAREASEQLGISKRAIYSCCTGRSRTSGGYIWKRKPI